MQVTTLELLTLWESLEWRHHGIGMLQAYLFGDLEHRVHVFHRSLLLEGMTEGGAWHDHRSDLESTVHLGSVTNSWLDVEKCEDGQHQSWIVRGASRPDAKFVQQSRVSLRTNDIDRFEAGGSYTVDRGRFHWARLEDEDADVAVTTVRLENKRMNQSASIVCPRGTQPRHAIQVKSPTVDRTIAMIAGLAHGLLYAKEYGLQR